MTTTAPDHWAYSSPGEVDELPAVHWVSTHMDATHPVVEELTLAEAEAAALYHVQQWADDPAVDVRVVHACLVADLGKWVDPHGFARLACRYQDTTGPDAVTMTTDDADTWAGQLRTYLNAHGWKA